MSVSEIMKSIDRLSSEEREQLHAYLKMRRLMDDAGFKQKIAERREEVAKGKIVHGEDLRELDRFLNSKGL